MMFWAKEKAECSEERKMFYVLRKGKASSYEERRKKKALCTEHTHTPTQKALKHHNVLREVNSLLCREEIILYAEEKNNLM